MYDYVWLWLLWMIMIIMETEIFIKYAHFRDMLINTKYWCLYMMIYFWYFKFRLKRVYISIPCILNNQHYNVWINKKTKKILCSINSFAFLGCQEHSKRNTSEMTPWFVDSHVSISILPLSLLYLSCLILTQNKLFLFPLVQCKLNLWLGLLLLFW